jgi:hypothetical protein
LKRSGTFNLHQADDDQEMQDEQYHEDHVKMSIMSKDTLEEKENSFNDFDMEMQDVEPMDLTNFPEMTEDELDQAHC